MEQTPSLVSKKRFDESKYASLSEHGVLVRDKFLRDRILPYRFPFSFYRKKVSFQQKGF